MTRLLVRVSDMDDVEAGRRGGADRLDLRLTDAMRLDAQVPGPLRLSSDGTAPGDLAALHDRAVRLEATEIAIPRGAVEAMAALPQASAAQRPALVAILAAEDDLVAQLAGLAGLVVAVMVEPRADARLMVAADIARLDAFARASRALGIPFGFAGGLEAPDVARLLVLRPDMLGFHLAARHEHRADRGVDIQAVAALRALLPLDSVAPHATTVAHRDETDHIFVHDFVALLSIGAYQAERGMRQRVRFSVDADVRRPTEPPTDMRGVFSYDIIIETIRVLAERPHVTFVETLAEELATRLLAYPQLTLVTIKVEKLDVIEGSVGIVIHRDRHGTR